MNQAAIARIATPATAAMGNQIFLCMLPTYSLHDFVSASATSTKKARLALTVFPGLKV
jgi:hypothetical protein